MSHLQNTRGYLSGCIEYDKHEKNWRNEPKRVLIERFKINLFDPFDDPKQQWVAHLKKARDEKNYDEMARIAKAFVRKDLCMVDRSDFLIAYLPHSVPTTGTHHEIINSSNAKKPTLLVCPQGKENLAFWYYGFVPHDMMFGSWEELYNYLDEVNQGLHKNNDKWGFVYGLI